MAKKIISEKQMRHVTKCGQITLARHGVDHYKNMAKKSPMTVTNKEILYNRWRKILEKKETSDWNPEEKKWAGYLQIPTIKTLKEMH